ncbi:hypothetical protein NM208_g3372 [Fusarium decemcellulare]|uniref:Uncharacterized protein n=1 Tax=Fusarium decemcellulare TaxID=57161 RepID=A0ACC1SPF4_9HYPO|nr:hypothetical protein NM208_g3372 [Fusarium decemcellulare]
MSVVTRKKTVLISGCSSGIGKALAIDFHNRGYNVVATARRLESIAPLADMGMTTLSLDITKQETIESLKPLVDEATGGQLDILVNNAGTTAVMPLADATYEHASAVFHTNLFGHMAMVSSFLPLLMAAKGTVLNISSASSIAPFPFRGLYAMTKAALNAYGRNLAIELSPFGVHVSTVIAGYVETGLSNHSTLPLPEDSLYKVLEGQFRRGNPAKCMPADVFARQVVDEVEKGRGWGLGSWRFGAMKEWLWAGTSATVVSWLALLGEGVLQRLSKNLTKWDQVTEILVEANKV